MAEDSDTLEATLSGAELAALSDLLRRRTDGLTISANGFAGAMGRAFSQAVAGGKQFDDVLKSLALRLSGLAVTAAFKPLATGIVSGLNQLLAGLLGAGGGAGLALANGGIKPFAAGGVIAAPTYFPLSQGGLGLAGEAGPEAVMPLARGPDGRLGVAASGQGSAQITVHIATPDLESFRRSENYITGQIARAVARGQRTL
jgi:phage-related minor tail protein